MKFYTAILVLISHFACGQLVMKDSTLDVVVGWKKGDHRFYDVTRIAIATKGKDTLANDRASYRLAVTVMDSTSEGYLLRWHYSGFRVNTKDAWSRRLVELGENSSVVVMTDHYGTYKGIENWEVVRNRLHNRLDSVLHDFPDVPNLKDIVMLEKEKLSTRFSIEHDVMSDAAMFHFFFGRRLVLGKSNTASTPIKPPGGTKEVNSWATMALEGYDPARKVFTFRFTLQGDKDQLAEVGYEESVKTSQKINKPYPKPEAFTPVENWSVLIAEVHPSGWVFSYSRKARASNETDTYFNEISFRLSK